MSPVRPMTTPNPHPMSAPTNASPQKPVAAAAMPDAGNASIEPPAAPATTEAKREAPNEAANGGLVKPGLWQFTTRLLGADAAAGQPSSTQKEDDGGIAATYTSCVTAEDAVPAAFGGQCAIEHKERKGDAITWTTNCPGTHAHSDGVAQYHGDTMEATLHSQLPSAGSKTMNVTQHVTGRYLGACMATAALPAAPNDEAQKPSDTNEAAAEPDMHVEHQAQHTARRTYRRYSYRRYHSGWAVYDRGASFAGPAPYSNAGP